MDRCGRFAADDPKSDRLPGALPSDAAFTQALCADEQGFSLHAAVRYAARSPGNWIVPPPQGGANFGSSVGSPLSSSSPLAGKRLPSLTRRPLMPLVVMEHETSTKIGVSPVGMPKGLGFESCAHGVGESER